MSMEAFDKWNNGVLDSVVVVVVKDDASELS
jgi:hypothetical protein